jgi:hypothetical protein
MLHGQGRFFQKKPLAAGGKNKKKKGQPGLIANQKVIFIR